MEKRVMDGVSPCGSCLIQARVNRNKVYLINHIALGLPILCYHF